MTENTSAYHPLTVEEAINVARTVTNVFYPTDELICDEIGDGNLNLVFRVRLAHSSESASHTPSLIVKQALPYAKVVGESWPLTLERARIESDALLFQGKLVPQLVPHVHYYDATLAMTVMEDLSDHVIMRKGLIEGNRYPLFADHISEFLAHTLFFSSDLGMNQQQKKWQVQRFINPELCKITEDLIFDDPYTNSPNNNIDEQLLADHAKLCADHKLHLEVALLREKFLTSTQALLHGDLHTGSIFITPHSTKVIDPEFAYYGPIGFDIGAIFANLLLNAAGHEHWSLDDQTREEHRTYLLSTLCEIWNRFDEKFRSLWDEHGVDRISRTKGYQDVYMEQILQDTVGYTGSKMIRRIVGLAHVADVGSIPNQAAKLRAQRIALQLGTALVKSNRRIRSIEEMFTICEHAYKGVYTS
ncbi:S-methyl-5-thioribose kinase [Paenibacillus arenosi]|uniref:Methylthioribose kinase n=1 Tax=Paenibacillus arenosi TaxID=2774142 RepID=A0ABR9B1B6_9BACL|nr:S-methyl-5-thioribose kinase [Paenibacillus arenosi]MBD8500160.1 S-methyl-5-thioribose kinase [Paenibacillus arenosi]